MSHREISNSDDVIDSRDVIARIDELESELEDLESKKGELVIDGADDLNDSEKEELAELEQEIADLKAELEPLQAFADEASGSEDWIYGASCIRDSYFEDYAREFAEDIGAISNDVSWPNTCIDWEQAARELQMDYMSAEWDGVTYWIR